ncbi:DUF4439 domain-containing protein [Pseudarthrobacter sp. PH31-O2]|nr:DUF4439 domain-containing protein [Pseudarthrobacter sp. PH31-O2]
MPTMTKWSVVKEDSRQKQWRELVPRVALLACLALVVASLGLAWRPAHPMDPAEPPFSEQARSAALAETLRLRTAGAALERAAAGAPQPAVARTVSLLTSQSRALLLPGQEGAETAPPAGTAAQSAAPTEAPPAVPLPASAAELAAALAASASQRLADANAADGGMARLLAAVGTAQLLQASSLAAAAGAPAPAVADPAAPQLSGACQGVPASPSSAAGPSAGTPAATLPAALAAAVASERETVYGYQVALTRLGGTAAGPASAQLARHETLAAGAEALSRMHCVAVPPREAGYTSAPAFLAAPAAGLGALEASALAVYGDLVALSEGQTRQWAVAGLVGAARSAARWGTDAGALPGLTADQDAFPELPAPALAPAP